ncbi:hypothetical protein lerEdw1_006931, partial [Lerista edwardsae]
VTVIPSQEESDIPGPVGGVGCPPTTKNKLLGQRCGFLENQSTYNLEAEREASHKEQSWPAMGKARGLKRKGLRPCPSLLCMQVTCLTVTLAEGRPVNSFTGKEKLFERDSMLVVQYIRHLKSFVIKIMDYGFYLRPIY